MPMSAEMSAMFDPHPDLRVEVEDGVVVLKVVPLADYPRLSSLVAAGLFPSSSSTLGDWYDPDDLQASARLTVAFHANAFANVAPESWDLPLGVYVDGVLAGVQSLSAHDWPVCRSASTGSWLAPEFRGQGFGRQARFGVLEVAFGQLHADWVTSSALASNEASKRVSLASGYVEDGLEVVNQAGEAQLTVRYRLSRERWLTRRRPQVSCSGFGSWLRLVNPFPPFG